MKRDTKQMVLHYKKKKDYNWHHQKCTWEGYMAARAWEAKLNHFCSFAIACKSFFFSCLNNTDCLFCAALRTKKKRNKKKWEGCWKIQLEKSSKGSRYFTNEKWGDGTERGKQILKKKGKEKAKLEKKRTSFRVVKRIVENEGRIKNVNKRKVRWNTAESVTGSSRRDMQFWHAIQSGLSKHRKLLRLQISKCVNE